MDPVKPKASAKILAAIQGVPRNARRLAAKSQYFRVVPMVAAEATDDGAVRIDGELVVPAATSYIIDGTIHGVTIVSVPVTTTMREANHVEATVSEKMNGAPVLVVTANVKMLRVDAIEDINAVLKGEEAEVLE